MQPPLRDFICPRVAHKSVTVCLQLIYLVCNFQSLFMDTFFSPASCPLQAPVPSRPVLNPNLRRWLEGLPLRSQSAPVPSNRLLSSKRSRSLPPTPMSCMTQIHHPTPHLSVTPLRCFKIRQAEMVRKERRSSILTAVHIVKKSLSATGCTMLRQARFRTI